tara:strand:- start:627 stop:839 length:213 start_codon:yes stop_codon:yes gene_type:complete
MDKLLTPYDGLFQALYLAITAPTEEQSKECIEMAKGLSVGLSCNKIEEIKEKVALKVDLENAKWSQRDEE